MKLALLATDSREHLRNYAASVPYFGAAPEALFQGLAVTSDIEVHVVSCAQQQMRSPEKLADNIWFHSLLVPKIGWLRTGYQGCIRAVRRKLNALQPDIVHGQGTERECAISAALSGFPNVVTIHGNMAELARLFNSRIGIYGWLAARLENFTLKRTGGVFCNSQYTERLVKPRTRRTWRVPNPIRQEFFRPSSQSIAAECILISVGVISPRKRQLEMLETARKLHDLGLKFEFQFIGRAAPSDPYAAAFLEKIKPMERTGYARYLGQKSTRELIDCFDRAVALVHFPSEEAFGLVVAEALARNLKLFGSAVGGIIDVASGIPESDLLDVDDWDGLTSAIESWIRNGFPRLREASKIMQSRYHPAVIARSHFDIYRDMLNG